MTNGKILVGSSDHINRRHSQHLWNLRRGIHNNSHLQSAFNIYGEISFKMTVLELCEKKDLLGKEDWWIHEKMALDRNYGFNFKLAFRPAHGEETCRRIAASKMGCKNPMYGKPLSEEHRRKISAAQKGKLGKKHSEESKKKMSMSQTGKKLSDDTKRKIGNANIGKLVSEETRKKMSDLQQGDKAWNLGRKASAETRKKMSDSQKGKPHHLSDDGRKKLIDSMSGKNNPMFGKKPSEETILKRLQTRMANKARLLEEISA